MAEQKIEVLEDIFCVLNIATDKNKLHKKYAFIALTLEERAIITNWADAVKWSEIFNAFCRGFLIQNQTYDCGSTEFSFGVGNKSPTLKMKVLGDDKIVTDLYQFSKLDCLSAHSIMHKILSRCEPIWV